LIHQSDTNFLRCNYLWLCIVVPLPIQHKLNYLLFFWGKKKYIYYLRQNCNRINFSIVRFEPKTFKNNNLKLRQFLHTKLFHNTENSLFIILYNHYLPKFSKLKNQLSKLRFKTSFNYSAMLLPKWQKYYGMLSIRQLGSMFHWMNKQKIKFTYIFEIQFFKCFQYFQNLEFTLF
jgi:hypothetical protein